MLTVGVRDISPHVKQIWNEVQPGIRLEERPRHTGACGIGRMSPSRENVIT